MRISRADIKKVMYSRKLPLDTRGLYLRIALSPNGSYKNGFRGMIRRSKETKYRLEKQLHQLLKENLINKHEAHIKSKSYHPISIFNALPVSQSKL